MPRRIDVFIEDILVASEKIERYVKGLTPEIFREDERTIDAVVRNLEVIAGIFFVASPGAAP